MPHWQEGCIMTFFLPFCIFCLILLFWRSNSLLFMGNDFDTKYFKQHFNQPAFLVFFEPFKQYEFVPRDTTTNTCQQKAAGVFIPFLCCFLRFVRESVVQGLCFEPPIMCQTPFKAMQLCGVPNQFLNWSQMVCTPCLLLLRNKHCQPSPLWSH